jgi:hypothetical protein
MGKVTTSLSMSLDGFIAGPHDDVSQLFKWYFSGDTDIPVQGGRMTLKVSPQSAKLIQEASRTNGAMVAGRRKPRGAGFRSRRAHDQPAPR